MSDMDSFFKIDKRERDSHPLVRLLDVRRRNPDFGKAKVQIIRPRSTLGFESAKLSVQFFDQQGEVVDYKTELWDDELNDALLEREIPAIDDINEIQRFGLSLGAALQRPESRYGDGFFSAVLMQVVDRSPFAQMAAVRDLRPYISTNRPYDRGHSVDDCEEMINAILQDRWRELRLKLKYGETEGERILAGALAYYLDERFSITDGQKFGWLKTN